MALFLFVCSQVGIFHDLRDYRNGDSRTGFFFIISSTPLIVIPHDLGTSSSAFSPVLHCSPPLGLFFPSL